MPRLIEIVLFLAPFAALFIWRRYFRSAALPFRLLLILAGLVLTLLAGLVWTRQQAAGDAGERYAPATMEDGRVIPGGPVRSP
jgi:hypothetical protein